MENVGSVAVYVNSLNFIAMNIPSSVVATVDNEAFLTSPGGLVGENAAEKSSSND